MERKMLFQVIHFSAPQIPLANGELLCRYYDAVKASPLTSTRAYLKTEAGLVFNGSFAGGSSSRCVNRWWVLMCVLTILPGMTVMDTCHFYAAHTQHDLHFNDVVEVTCQAALTATTFQAALTATHQPSVSSGRSRLGRTYITALQPVHMVGSGFHMACMYHH